MANLNRQLSNDCYAKSNVSYIHTIDCFICHKLSYNWEERRDRYNTNPGEILHASEVIPDLCSTSVVSGMESEINNSNYTTTLSHQSKYCDKRFIRGEPIFMEFVGQQNDEFINPLKYIFIFNYATTLMVP